MDFQSHLERVMWNESLAGWSRKRKTDGCASIGSDCKQVDCSNLNVSLISPPKGMEEKMTISKDLCILVVDDYASMRKVLKKFLREIGFRNVIEAEDGNDAWKKLNATNVDLVISDWNMPNMNGMELLRKIRKSEQFEQLNFIMVTVEGSKQNIVEAVSLKVSNYIVKPFNLVTLKRKIEAVFEG